MPSSLPGRVPFCSPRCLLTCPGGRRGPGCLTSSISTGTHRAAASSPRSRRSVWSGRTNMPTGGARPQSPAGCERTTVPRAPLWPLHVHASCPARPGPAPVVTASGARSTRSSSRRAPPMLSCSHLPSYLSWRCRLHPRRRCASAAGAARWAQAARRAGDPRRANCSACGATRTGSRARVWARMRARARCRAFACPRNGPQM